MSLRLPIGFVAFLAAAAAALSCWTNPPVARAAPVPATRPAVPAAHTPDEWAQADDRMAELLRAARDAARRRDALAVQYPPTHPAVRAQAEVVRRLDADAAAHQRELESQFDLRLTKVPKPAGPTGSVAGPAGVAAPSRPATGPANGLFEGVGEARRIVFVCDCTGTMINKMPEMKQELRKAIASLDERTQEFKVIGYTDNGKVLAQDAKGLVPASAQNKRATIAWADNIPAAGTTDPLPALRAAFALNPDRIYYLSDGEFNNLRSYEEVIDAVRKLNAGNRAKVFTILLETNDPEGAQAMRTIATQNGGRFRYVKLSDLDGAR